MASRSDTELDALLARLADGDRSAFTPAFQRLWVPVLRLCMGMLHNEADASDAAQQAMEKILVRASDYDSNRPGLPWALAIAGWECRTMKRRRTRRREVSDEVVIEAISEHAEDEVVRRSLVEAALEAIGELSPTDRETLVATFADEAGSVSGATFRKRRERALTHLRVAFRRLYGLD
jgi:RNA polymerase sigma-70 factor (ECF subfamily)